MRPASTPRGCQAVGCSRAASCVTWPIGSRPPPRSPLADVLADLQGYITFDIDATADSWAFFEQHSRQR